MEDTLEQKLIDLSKKVASVTMMSWQEVRRMLRSFIGVDKAFELANQLEELAREVNRAPIPKKKGDSSYWVNSPWRRELVTRRGPRSLVKSSKTQRRRYRNIRRKGSKNVRSRNSACESRVQSANAIRNVGLSRMRTRKS